jgi:hypothetical protein
MSPFDDDELFERRYHGGDPGDHHESNLTRGQARTIRALLRANDQPVPADLVDGLGIVDPLETIAQLRQRVNPNLSDDHDDQPPGSRASSVALRHLHDRDAGLADGAITRDEIRSIHSLLHRLDEPVPVDIRELGIVDPFEYIRELDNRLEPMDMDAPRSEWIPPILDGDPLQDAGCDPLVAYDSRESRIPRCWPYWCDAEKDE